MKSLVELYKIGCGPSSSHTMGPEKAVKLFCEAYPHATSYKVTLYGSLALTGKGHGTDAVIKKTATKPVEIVFDAKTTNLPHPNTMEIFALDGANQLGFWRVFSVGGGAIAVEGQASITPLEVYPHNSFEQICAFCRANEITLPQYVERFEGVAIWDYLANIWGVMKQSIDRGLVAEGVLAGGLGTERKAKILYNGVHPDETTATHENRIVCAYAFAVSEENASGGTIVTAPTCGACGVLPAVLKYQQTTKGLTEQQVLEALATAGIIGNLIKTNASISGAECGCQAEIGSACSMAAAAVAQIGDMDLDQIEYAAEIAMEHHLGLTCDPIGGLVQIPCIERNAVAAMRALNAVSLATFLTHTRKISFDTVVNTMYQTGRDLRKEYRETSEGGLAKNFPHKPE
ncbi:MAG: L-serine ammonia-lyase [Clostridia bacterium]|nr:L-serine ammonia-lyase [Clostridia bacterium]